MRRIAFLAALALGALAASSSPAQWGGGMNAFVRPPLGDQIDFYYPHHHFYRRGFFGHGEFFHHPEPFNCARDWRHLEEVVRRLHDFDTLELHGSGPACTLSRPLIVDHAVRLIGFGPADKASIVAAPGGPCIDVLPGAELFMQGIRVFSYDNGPKQDCIHAVHATLTLIDVGVSSPGATLHARDSKVELRESEMSGGGDGADVVLHGSEFVIADSHIRAIGDALDIRAPDHGVAAVANTDLTTRGRENVGLTLEPPEGDSSALVTLDRISIREFATGIAAGPHTRAVASQILIFGNSDTGIDLDGAGFTLLQSVILHGRLGIRMHGYGAPDIPAGEPRIEGNRIARVYEAGVVVEEGTPGAVRDNKISARHSRCIVGGGVRGDIRESLNYCTDERGERGFLAGVGPWFVNLFHGNNHLIEPWLYSDVVPTPERK